MFHDKVAAQLCLLTLFCSLAGSTHITNVPVTSPELADDLSEDTSVSLLQKSLDTHKSISAATKYPSQGLPMAALNEAWRKKQGETSESFDSDSATSATSKQVGDAPSDNYTVTKTTETHTYTYSKTVVVVVNSDAPVNSSTTAGPTVQETSTVIVSSSSSISGSSSSISASAQSTTTVQDAKTSTSTNISQPLPAAGSPAEKVQGGSSANAPSPGGPGSGPDQGGKEAQSGHNKQEDVNSDHKSGADGGKDQPEYELDLSASSVPQKNKVILVLLELVGLGLCGVDRCYMGQVCVGVVKGLTLGGLLIWAFLDYFFVIVTCLTLSRDINAIGIRAHFGKADTTWAFVIVLLGLALKLSGIRIAGRAILARFSRDPPPQDPPPQDQQPPTPASPRDTALPMFSGTPDSPVTPSIPSRPRSQTGPGSPCERKLTESLDGLAEPKKKELDDVLGRSKVFLDREEQRVRFRSPIDFKPRRHGADSSAELKDEEEAMSILRDAAELLEVLESAIVVVEGHTATPDEKLDDWAHELARNRAECVLHMLVKLGVSADRLTAVGKPGKFGTGDSEVLLQIENL